MSEDLHPDSCALHYGGNKCTCRQPDFVPLTEEELRKAALHYQSQNEHIRQTALHLHAENARLREELTELVGYVRAHLFGEDADPELRYAVERSAEALEREEP